MQMIIALVTYLQAGEQARPWPQSQTGRGRPAHAIAQQLSRNSK